MFEKMISWGELITIVLFVLGAALLFYLILALANLLKILKNEIGRASCRERG